MRACVATVRKSLLSGAGLACLALLVVPAQAQGAAATASYRIPAQPLANALRDFGVQSGITIMVDAAITRGKRSPGFSANADPETALRALLNGTGLGFKRDGNVFVVTAGAIAQGGPLQTDGALTVEDIIVTAQKREESILDVPIAVSAFSAQSLNDHKIESGAELLRAVPNVTFSKANFSGYNFSIRGIGTKAVSASTDPAVAISFNNTPLLRNRLFEQEFFDVERVEVLRGPQGTLYGRNATGGVVNIITALPTDIFEGEIKGEVGSFDTKRLSAIVNVPITDSFALRAAGSMTKRDGFDYNSFTKRHVNDRDLWSTRVTAQWTPTETFKANFIWQHFEEDDQRSRTGKQLCTRDPGPTMVGDTPVLEHDRPLLSQGCLPGSLYDDAAYGTPNGLIFAFVRQANQIGYGFPPFTGPFPDIDSAVNAITKHVDPFAGVTQSRNLREIATAYDPVFRAKNDVFQLNLELGLRDDLQFVSQTAYTRDRYYSSQDYNRFVSNPIFNASNQGLVDVLGQPMLSVGPTPNGVYTDPQLGPSDRMAAVDLSQSRNRQWSQEFRLQSDFSGPLNFNVGANYLNFKSKDDYYVFNNLFSLLAEYFYNRDQSLGNQYIETLNCAPNDPRVECVYVDPNPIDRIDGEGHNYFRSKNRVKTESWALFGETYWQVSDTVKLTGGLRFTQDRKTSTPYPSQLLLGNGPNSGGNVNQGYPALPDIKQKWGRFTGRIVADWKPETSFSDDTLVYGSFAHGYKGGGANPPRVDINPAVVQYLPLAETFKPEYVNAFEIGTKNSFAGGKFSLNATAFYYDYKDYQVSQIVDRISLNENFDAESWGIELEAAWRPSRNFRMDANFGYLDTRLKKGARSIDVMNRTQGNEDWVVLRPWLQVPSNCVAPREHVETILGLSSVFGDYTQLALASLCNGSARTGSFNPDIPTSLPWYAIYGFTYDPLTEAPNGGRGFEADLEGNELPNSPHFTFNVGAQYTFFLNDWNLTFRGDYYRQSKSFSRVYNTTFDRLKGWDNANLAVTLDNADRDIAFQFYVKNLFNDTPITDAFTNSDDTGLTANVFTLDPRIFGFSITKRF